MPVENRFSFFLDIEARGQLRDRGVWRRTVTVDRAVPQLTDVASKAGIKFEHMSAPEKKYIVESMPGGVIVLDYDRDGWADIYFTNAPTVSQALQGWSRRSPILLLTNSTRCSKAAASLTAPRPYPQR